MIHSSMFTSIVIITAVVVVAATEHAINDNEPLLSCDMHRSVWELRNHKGEVVMGGDQAAVFMNGRWGATSDSSESTIAEKLFLASEKQYQGSDNIGNFDAYASSWAHLEHGTVVWVTTCKTYKSFDKRMSAGGIVVFESEFPIGANNTNVPGASSSDGVLSNFPLAKSYSADSYLSWEGEFVRPANRITYGLAGGPVVFYHGNDPLGLESTVLVGGPLNNFKATSSSSMAFDGSKGVWAPGTSGTITSLEPGFTHKIMVVVPVNNMKNDSSSGVTAAVRAFGSVLTTLHNTRRVTNDTSLSGLQYQTDNGAQYCFCTTNCDEKLVEVQKDLLSEKVPKVQSLSFQGGWWTNPKLHTRYCAPWCVTTWEPNMTKFPSGEKFKEAVDLPFQLYAPYFCMDTPYANDWNMMESDVTLPGCSGYAFKTPKPDEAYNFYRWFMGWGKQHWGMTSFEPDFLHQNFICVPDFIKNATAQHTWFNGMHKAAADEGLAMQWCMATPSDLLLALDYEAVTNFRVTTDYYYGSSWDVGPGSLLLWSLGAAPSKDTFWTSNQSDVAIQLGGCPSSGCPDDHSDAGGELHTMLALFTTGPVGFSDAAGRTNATLLWRIASADGTLIPPSRPLTSVDRSYDTSWKNGLVLSTYSGDGNDIWGYYMVGHQQVQSFSPNVAEDFYPSPSLNSKWVWRLWHSEGCLNGSTWTQCVSTTIPDIHAAAPKGSEEHYRPTLTVGARVCDSGFALLGALDKYASLSNVLFESVSCNGQEGLRVKMGAITANISIVQPCSIGHDSLVVQHEAKAGSELSFSDKTVC